MMNEPKHTTPTSLEQTTRLLLTITSTVVALAAAGLLIHYFYAMTALLGSVLIATYLLLAPVNLLEMGIIAISDAAHRLPPYKNFNRHFPEANPRILAVLIVYIVFFVGIFLGSVRFVPVLTTQMGDMGQKLGTQVMDASEHFIDWADHNIGQGTIRDLFVQDIRQAEQKGVLKTPSKTGKPVSPEEVEVIQESVLQNAITRLGAALTSAVPNVIGMVAGTINGFVYFLAGILATYFFLIDGGRLKKDFLGILPRMARPTTSYLLESFHQVMFAFIKGQVLLGLLTGVYMFIIYTIFNVPYAFLLGCIFAVAELLPVVGTWIGIIVGLTIILMNMDPMIALYVWACSYAYQTVKDNILAPKVVGDVMGLHPMVIIVALLVCAQVAGLLGVLLALPLASLINVIIRLLLQNDADSKKAMQEQAGGQHGTINPA